MTKLKSYPACIIAASLFLLMPFVVSAQQPSSFPVNGTTYAAEANEPLQGVYVRDRNNGKTTLSGQAGRFMITASIGDTLEFSHVGYTTVRKVVTGSKQITVTLLTDARQLEDVVVMVGYGAVKRKDMTGSVGEVKMADLAKAPVTEFNQAMAGRIAGVQVSSNEDQPGSAMKVVIRGGNSLTQDNSPLYVIDGFPIDDFNTAALNPSDIESITILKDASATAIYGSRGANGVVVVTTRHGKTGKPQVVYNTSVGFQEVTRKIETMSPYEFVKYQLELYPESDSIYLYRPSRTLDDYKNLKALDWQDRTIRNVNFQTHNLSFAGGNAQTKYTVSGSLANQNGIVVNSGYKRYQGRIALDQTISSRIKAGVKLNYSHELSFGQLASTLQTTSTGYSTYLMYKVWGYRPVTGAVDIIDQLYDDEEKVGLGDARINPLISLENEIREQKRKTFNANAFAAYEIIKGLVLQVQGGMISRISTNEQFFNSKTARGFPSANNLDGVNGSFSYNEITDLVNENTLTYKKEFSKIHTLDIVAGYTMQRRQSKTYGYAATQIPNESLGLSGIDNGMAGALKALLTENRLNSYLGRVNYHLLSRYLFTATFRADGSSKFSPANRWGYFPSAAFAWRISNESFMKKFSFINDARIRVSYGLTGNNRIGDFSRYGSFDMAYNGYYSYNNSIPDPGIAPDDLGNSILKWESTAQANVGLSLELFKGRINFEADVYRKTTNDLLLNANLPTSSGYASVYKNIGSIRNDGLELTLNTINVKKGKFSWGSDFNISFNSNKIIALAEGEEKILSDLSWTSTYNGQFLYMASLGHSASSFFGYVWDGVYQYADFDQLPNGTYVLKTNVPGNGTNRSTIQPGDIRLKDVNDDGVVDAKDQVVIGRGLPVHYGGFNNNFSYGPVSLNIFFQWSYGNDIYNANRIMFEGNSERRGNLNQYASYADRWSPDNQDSKNYRANGQGLTSIYTSRVLEDGSYLRLKTVALAYALPASWMKKIQLQSLQLSLAAQNLYTWTNYSGMDPEVSVRDTPLTPGFDYSAYPRARTITVGLKATF